MLAVIQDSVWKYARMVVDGEIVVGKWVRLACERHLNDLERQGTDDFPWVFDVDRAEKKFRFTGLLRHIEGDLAGQPIVLEPFQKFIQGNVFGWVHKDTGKRRFRRVYVQVGRKNGKSTMLSDVGLYMTYGDGEPGAQVFATATKKDQARIVYNAAMEMVRKSKVLSKRLKAQEKGIFYKPRNSVFKPLSKDTKSLDGFNPHLGILDEYHEHPTSAMYDVLVSGMGKRSQPLLFIITTAGFNLNGPCYKEYQYCRRVLEGEVNNDRYFIYIAQLDDGDDLNDEKNWIKANPLLAATPEGILYLKEELQIAQDAPEKMRGVLTKNFDYWVDMPPDGYMPMSRWMACGERPAKGDLPERKIPDLRGCECYAGVDLSMKMDLTSVTFEFPLDNGWYAVKSHSFMPEETYQRKLMETDRIDYASWVRNGWLTLTTGAVVDYEYIMQYIEDRRNNDGWAINEIDFDPYNATQFSHEMAKLGYEVVEIRQRIGILSEPTKHIRELVLQGRLIHDNNPVLTWSMGNAIQKMDPQENIMLDKAKSTNRIDPAAALINAHVRAMVNEPVTDWNARILDGESMF